MKGGSLGLKLDMYYSKRSQCQATQAQPKCTYAALPKIQNFVGSCLSHLCNSCNIIPDLVWT